MMENKRFCYDWKTGGFKDTLNSSVTTDIRIFETQINNACLDYEKKIKKLERENEELKQSNKYVWTLIRFIYNEIREEGCMDWGRIQDLVEF